MSLVLSITKRGSKGMQITHLRTDHHHDSIGYNLDGQYLT